MVLHSLKKLYEKVKQTVKENPILTVAVLAAAGLLAYKMKTNVPIPEAKLSYLIMALKNNMVSEVVVSGSDIYFKSVGSDALAMTNASMLSKDQLYNLLFANPSLNVTCQEKVAVNPLALVSLGISAFLAFKASRMMSGPDIQNIKKDKKSKSVSFNDIYGHEDTKKTSAH